MAFITLNREKLIHNFNFLDKLFADRGIRWSVVTKVLCGNRDFLRELLKCDIKQVCDSRIRNLRIIKEINPAIETIYIKPPAHSWVKSVVEYADISVNTEVHTIKLLSEEAQRQNKIHKVIIMIELGELREGVMREGLIDFYAEVFKCKNIEIVGVGANLSCLYGVLPSHDKLIQLSLYKQLIEAKFNKSIPYVSGGTSVTISLIFQHTLPEGVNHFRVGETLFLGTDVYNNTPLPGMERNVFTLHAGIIELTEKPLVPTGEMGTNLEGEVTEFDQRLIGQSSHRAIVDVGLLDIDRQHLHPTDPMIEIVGASSDMLVIDLKENAKSYKVGDQLEFTMDYMGILRVLNSKYIGKFVV